MTPEFKYALFFDFHTSGRIGGIGKDFHSGEFTDRIAGCGADFITFHARCNQGYAYYDTRIGIRHPGLSFDLFGELAGACREKGIRLAAYFNGTLSDAEARLHCDWNVISPEGRVYPEHSRITPYCRKLCMNSPWRDHLASMMEEVLEKYTVAGFFVDCVHPQKCICPFCVEKMRARGLDVKRAEDVDRFSFDSAVEFCAFLSERVRKRKPDATVCYNGGLEEPLRESVSHVECECLPTAGWGYSFLPVAAHYFRNAAPGKSVLNMTGRFLDWGDFGGLRSRASLEFDMFYGAANGMRPDIGTHLPPSGQWETPVFERVRDVYREMRKYDRWTLGAENCAEIAIVSTREPSGIVCNTSVRGATQMLSELKYPFDIFSENGAWEKCPLVIFPDTMRFSARMAERVRQYVADGGRVISSGSSSMAWEKDVFTLPEIWGAEAEPGGLLFTPAYFIAENAFSAGLPDMPLAVYADSAKLLASPDSESAACFVRPLVSREWDGICADYYTPPGEKTELPFLLFHGRIAVFAPELFFGYANSGSLPLRTIFAHALNRLIPSPLVKVDGLPSHARVFVQRKEHSVLVHILSYLPEKRVNAFVVEERLPIPPCRISLRRDGRNFRKVVLCPERLERNFEQKEEYCVANLPSGEGYALAVFEYT